MKNERTSKEVAAIAGRILKELDDVKQSSTLFIWDTLAEDYVEIGISAGEVETLAASALTQTRDKKRKPKKKKAKRK